MSGLAETFTKIVDKESQSAVKEMIDLTDEVISTVVETQTFLSTLQVEKWMVVTGSLDNPFTARAGYVLLHNHDDSISLIINILFLFLFLFLILIRIRIRIFITF